MAGKSGDSPDTRGKVPPLPDDRSAPVEQTIRNSHMIQLSINGEPRSVEAGLALAELLEQLGLAGKKLAVERNGDIVPRTRHADTRLENGDRLEIVVAVGGG